MWWKKLENPISGVANCHVKGLYSLTFSEDVRAFVTSDWTSLSGNFFGEALGFHDHHRALDIKVAVGQILNVAPKMNRGDRHPMAFRSWVWESKLRGGKGSFVCVDDGSFVSNDFACRTLDKNSPTLHLKQSDVHTIKQLSKMSMWFLRESGDSTETTTRTWSTQSLTEWHKQQPDLYQEMTPAAVANLWETMRGLM